jgi:hypothetical protein
VTALLIFLTRDLVDHFTSNRVGISREFGKSVDWLLTGKTHIESKNRATKDLAELE